MSWVEDAMQVARPGDVVFLAIPNFLYRRVARASGTWTSHVGFVDGVDDQGRATVAESRVPRASRTSLRKFLGRTEPGLAAIRRLPTPPTPAQIATLRSAAERRFGTLYHLGFDYDSQRTYCSKFVHDVFSEALGVSLGEIEAFRTLLERHPDQPLTFWRLWYFGRIPWNRRTVTPVSLLESPRLVTVWEGGRVSAFANPLATSELQTP